MGGGPWGEAHCRRRGRRVGVGRSYPEGLGVGGCRGRRRSRTLCVWVRERVCECRCRERGGRRRKRKTESRSVQAKWRSGRFMKEWRY